MTNPASEARVPSADAGELARVAVAVDVVILTLIEGELRLLLVRRAAWPFEGMWSIPGGFFEEHESLEHAAQRQLTEQTGVSDIFLEQLYTFGDPARDPRGRVITVVYYALIDAARLRPFPTENATTCWAGVAHLPPLAFDHTRIVESTLARLRGKLEYTTIGFQLLAPEFTLSELQAVYEAILQRKLDKRNFRKKIVSTGILDATERAKMEGPHRPARLYRFRENAER